MMYKCTHHHNEIIDPIDGDLKKVDIVDQSIDNGINPLMRTYYFHCGRPVHTEHLPTKLRVSGARHELADYISFRRVFICSEKCREAIESVEPGVHQFEPVELVWKNGEAAGKYFFLIYCNRVFAIDEELTTPPLVSSEKIWMPQNKGEDRLVFSSERAAQNHFFINAGLEGSPFCSGVAKDAILNAGLTGFDFKQRDVS